MVSILGNMQSQFQDSYHHIEDMARSLHQKVSYQISHTQDCMNQSFESMCQKGEASRVKIIEFVEENKATLFFIGCCSATAFFAPELFFSAAIITIICRVEIDRHLRDFMNKKWKDEENPYKINPLYGPSYVNSLELTLATIGTVDAIALGTIFVAGSLTVALIPALCGIAAGSSLAKWGIDIAYSKRPPLNVDSKPIFLNPEELDPEELIIQ